MIVLLTDFGESEYVGVMKGVILSIAPDASIIDLTHSISPQSVREAAWVLFKSYRFFPKQSIFVCVVDPSVGTERDAVIVETPDYVFIGPDNGLLYPAVKEAYGEKVYRIIEKPSISKTFHGRDVFALAAGHYHSGVSAREIGTQKPSLEESLVFHHQGRTGEIVRIDHFGNVVTNLPPLKKERVRISTDNFASELAFCETYASGPNNELFAIAGSAGTIELSAKNKRAVDCVSLTIGDYITIE